MPMAATINIASPRRVNPLTLSPPRRSLIPFVIATPGRYSKTEEIIIIYILFPVNKADETRLKTA